uniref:HOOK_N domain-containing protein n=1 Tax=Steinernema glaseri TaxID=37863 RepID=A0A1I7YV94_9BILA
MEEEEFWAGPLGRWIVDCAASGVGSIVPQHQWRCADRINATVEYAELCNGYVLNLIYFFIDPTSVNSVLVKEVASSNFQVDHPTRFRLFTLLLHNLHKFYRNRLNRLIVMTLPDVFTIVRNPTSDGSGHELNKVLLLLLGCAVQSDQKEVFINRIKSMSLETQTALVDEIKKITDREDIAVNIEALGLDTDESKTTHGVLDHLDRVMKERDPYALEVQHDHESDEATSTTGSSSINDGDIMNSRKLHDFRYDMRTPSPTTMERHANVELASIKAQVRKLRNELEEKDDQLIAREEELKDKADELSKLQQERITLVKDARDVKYLRDENVILTHEVETLKRTATEHEKCHKKLSDLEFYENRVQSLTADVDTMSESCRLLEMQLAECQQRLQTNMDFETKMIESQDIVKELQAELSGERRRIEDLLLENGHLTHQLKSFSEKNGDLERRVNGLDDSTPRERASGSLLDEMEDCNRSHILGLELENRKLRAKLDSSTNSVTDSEELGTLRANLLKAEIRLSEAHGENDKMTRQVERMAKEAKESAVQMKFLEEALANMREDRDVCMQNLQEARKNFSLFQNDMTNQMTEDFSKRTKELEALLAARKEELLIMAEDKQKIESQLDRLRVEQRESKVELEQMLEEASKTESALVTLERARKALEKEKIVLKEKLDKLEEELEEIKLRNMNNENLSRRLENAEKTLIERNDRISDLDADNRTLKQQVELESRKTNRLREDLISEKSKHGDLVARLRSVCAAIKSQAPRSVAEETKEHLTAMEDDVKLVEVIDDVIMGALNAARREADALRIQQQTQIQELNDLRRDIVNLRREDNEALNESGDRVKELSIENKNIKEQVAILQERLRKMQVDEQAKSTDLATARREIQELQQEIANSTKYTDELARAQVTIGNLQHETELLRQDNDELQKRLELVIRELDETNNNLMAEKDLREALLVDHDRLEKIHHGLATDYERVKFEFGKLKEAFRVEKSASSKSSFWEQDRQRLEEMLQSDRNRFQKEIDRLQADSARVKRDNHDLRAELDSIHNTYQSMQDELRKLRLMELSLKSTIGNKDNVIEELRRTIAKKDAEIQSLYDQLAMQRKSANEESQKYLRQIEMLLMQNQDLINRTLTDNDFHHAAQKELQEKLVAVQRHKEKLEEKIMDQYKAMDSRKIQKEKPTLVKRAARVLMPKDDIAITYSRRRNMLPHASRHRT